ncbi:bifunctional glycosyltransferase/CDP-glycerol:glycerophosphate glycerophosphotransferase [Specibacter sp. RAF43]|uniref:bifunctional glycosyltransferase/CDP-glycerol:glycerophosphate glycerophosphotransferase n=1 Tax=Specibacter sp. RAF43 TaxID=3233057 RepID=UPI003F994118
MKNIARRIGSWLPAAAKSKLRNTVSPQLQLALSRMASTDAEDCGLLSVVIPVYNVAEYLDECLASVLGQSYRNLEVILVDDGSIDGSASVAKKYAKWDRRVTLVELDHGGNGRARNVGIQRATGDFLTFADSDDVVCPGAYATMLNGLMGSGSEFIVGSHDRSIGRKRETTKLSSRLHKRRLTGVTIDDFPDILDDVFLWNKIFRRSFWDDHVGPIPEGVLYEDQETTARAYLRAKAFDVLTEIVYSWRLRGNGSSITQGKRSMRDLDDRMKVARHVTDLMLAEGRDEVVRGWYKRLFGSDLLPYYEAVPYTPESYWDILREGVRGLHLRFSEYDDKLAGIDKHIDPHARIFRELAIAGHKSMIEDLVVDRVDWGTGTELRYTKGRFIAEPNYWAHAKTFLPDVTMECAPEFLEIESYLRIRGTDELGNSRMEGHIFVRGLDSGTPGLTYSAWIENDSGARHTLTITNFENDYIDVEANDAFASHNTAGIAFSLPASVLGENSDHAGSLVLGIELDGHSFASKQDLVSAVNTEFHNYLDAPTGKPTVVGFLQAPDEAGFSLDVEWLGARLDQPVFLQTKKHVIHPESQEQIGNGIWRYNFRLANRRWSRDVIAPPSGAYTARYLPNGAPAGIMPPALKPTRDLSRTLPVVQQLEAATATIWKTPNGSCAVTIGPALSNEERSKYGRRVIHKSFESVQAVRIGTHLVFESFGGKFCTDSPRALSDELHRQSPNSEIYWSVVDGSVSVPEYAKTITVGSRDWCQKVQSAKVLINNNNFPHYFRKNPAQFYLQTWHGTPLKKIGLDAPKEYLSASYRRLMSREAEAWDILLAQNEYSAKVFPSAFGYSGPLLVSGYPRNDALQASDAPKRREDIRSDLGISASQHVILYAPTWRDHVKGPSGGRGWIGYLDLHEVQQKLGDSYFVLLRAHHNVTVPKDISTNAMVLDVSDYPELNDLILASDSLVTDYSSIMFDYAITDKPTRFLAPDLNEYENHTRGLYGEYASVIPGSYASDMGEFITHFHDTDSSAHHQKRQEFQRRFISMENGVSASEIIGCIPD